MESRELAALAFTAIAAGTDLCDGKIYNRITGTGCLLALLLSVFLDSCAGCGERLLGLLLPALLLFPLFAIGGLGGGDVKLFSMLGAFLGWRAVLLCMAYSAVFVAAYGVVLLCVRCIMRARQQQKQTLQRSFVHCAVPIMLGLWVRLEGGF